MQDNDFEKQVHQKMGELKLVPSEAVWEQVAMRLHRKEKRRRWILWIPLLFTALSLSGYFVIHNGHLLESASIQASAKKSALKQTDNNVSKSTADTSSALNDKRKTAISNIGSEIKFPDNTLTKILVTRNSIIHKHTSYPQNESIATGTPSSTNHINKLTVKTTTNTFPDLLRSDADDSPKEEAEPYTLKGTSGRLSDITATIEKVNEDENSFIQTPIKEMPLFTSEINTSLISIKYKAAPGLTLSQLHQNNRWEWGLSFQVGRSSFTNKGLNKSFSSGSGSNLFSTTNQPATNPNQFLNQVYQEPYPAHASAGFSAGAFLRKKLSQTFAVSFGINYTLFSTSTKVGKRADSILLLPSTVGFPQQLSNQYFRIGNTGSYTNNYHYIEIPVELQTRLTRNWKSPLYWNVGFSFSRLIASNALQFDNTLGAYYKNNELLNKTQFNIITGLPVTLSAHKRFVLQAGPELQYGLSNVLANKSSSSKHFLFPGVKANLVLGKK